ncbi:MAG: hypothetical protein JWM95_2373 [Gemmatimonadetes bacterium]|nr:hypothetical protein [Gemmatimonadota bacterium]
MHHFVKAPRLVLVAAMLTAACGSTEPPVSTRVRFVVDAPFCGNAYPVNFSIDNVQVGRDTLWFGVGADTSPVVTTGARKYKAYRSFSVGAGMHKVSATIVDTIPPYPPFIYAWADTTVNVDLGAEVVRKLPFYCS